MVALYIVGVTLSQDSSLLLPVSLLVLALGFAGLVILILVWKGKIR